MGQMTEEQVEEFLRAPRMANLITMRADGTPTSSPLWFEWRDGRAYLFTAWVTGKARRIQKNNRVALAVTAGTGEAPGWVTIEGTATLEPEGAADLARKLAPAYGGEEFAAKGLARLESDPNALALVVITPERISHW